MRLLAIVPSEYGTAPSQRFRIEQWEPYLKESGVEITYAPFETPELHDVLYQSGAIGRKLTEFSKAFIRRCSVIKSAKDFDAIYLLREAAILGPPIIERLLARTSVPFVFDFDDAVFVSYKSPSNGYLSYLKFAAKTKTICRLAAHVIAGNPYLEQYARQVNDNVTIIPTTIDTTKYQPKTFTSKSVPVIGWTGSYSTVLHLDTLRGALQKLAQVERFRLLVIGTPHYELQGVEVEAKQWKAETELDDLTPIDIGVMPLPDDQWSKGKCGLKALQFMALGVPTVCSPVGVNTDIITDGENGYLATTEEEWIAKLQKLLRSEALRKQVGMAGRQTVEKKYSAVVQAPRVLEVFASVTRNATARNQPVRLDASTRAMGRPN